MLHSNVTLSDIWLVAGSHVISLTMQSIIHTAGLPRAGNLAWPNEFGQVFWT